jgi:hypothetical protein
MRPCLMDPMVVVGVENHHRYGRKDVEKRAIDCECDHLLHRQLKGGGQNNEMIRSSLSSLVELRGKLERTLLLSLTVFSVLDFHFRYYSTVHVVATPTPDFGPVPL